MHAASMLPQSSVKVNQQKGLFKAFSSPTDDSLKFFFTQPVLEMIPQRGYLQTEGCPLTILYIKDCL